MRHRATAWTKAQAGVCVSIQEWISVSRYVKLAENQKCNIQKTTPSSAHNACPAPAY
jgi:hypothetical protein